MRQSLPVFCELICPAARFRVGCTAATICSELLPTLLEDRATKEEAAGGTSSPDPNSSVQSCVIGAGLVEPEPGMFLLDPGGPCACSSISDCLAFPPGLVKFVGVGVLEFSFNSLL